MSLALHLLFLFFSIHLPAMVQINNSNTEFSGYNLYISEIDGANGLKDVGEELGLLFLNTLSNDTGNVYLLPT